MSSALAARLADLILATHVAIIAFNVFGLVATPLGALQGWRFVRIAWWRALHLAAIGVVALQALLGRACFLTIWQAELLRAAGANASETPLLVRSVNALVYWRLPLWVFAVLYVAVCVYAVALWWLVPPRTRRGFAPAAPRT